MGILAIESASAALVVSAISLAISITGLCWQLVLYHLSGSRLDVRLIPGVITAHGDLIRAPQPGWAAEELPEPYARNLGDGYIDVAVIRVANAGRAPVSVSNIGLDFGREPQGWRRGWRYTMCAAPIPVHEGTDDAQTVRLEAGAAVTVIIDHLPLVDHAQAQQPNLRAVRATAHGAGKRRPTLSLWRRRWKISDKDIGLPGDHANPADLEAFREVFRVVARRDVKRLYSTWVNVTALWVSDVQPTSGKIIEALEDALDVTGPAMDIIEAGHKLERYGGPARLGRIRQAEP